MLKGVIFDMDGVIIDSEPSHAKAIENALSSLGISLPKEYPYRFIGSTTEYMLKMIIIDFNLSVSVKALNDLYNEALATLIKEEGYIPVPYVIDLIRSLHREGYSLAIASSSTPEEIAAVTDALEISSCFEKLVSGATVQHPKPAPDVFLKTLSELNLEASECIIIEDSSNGVKAACAAGIPVIGYINPNSGNQDLSLASILVEGFDEIDSAFFEKTYCRYHNLPVIIAKTERLLIKEIPVEDIPALKAIYQKSEINKFLPELYNASLDSPETAIQKHKAYIKNMYQFYNLGLWGVYLKSGELIGQCGIEPHQVEDKVEMEIGYFIDVPYQKNHYAKEALDAILTYAARSFNLSSFTALILPENTASSKFAVTLGFSYSGEITRNGILYHKYCIKN